VGRLAILKNSHHLKGALMKIHAPLHSYHGLAGLFAALFLIVALGQSASAQSTELEYPTPVRANEISGTITARDLGDPRLTRYYYSLTGTPGDLIVIAEGRNLEGDVDVFTAGTLRPLAKVSFYAGGTTSGGAKTIYLKNRESLILRVEARTPNDNEGSFRIRFEGSFEPVLGDVVVPDPVGPPSTETSSAGKKTRRVNAVGARIAEPEEPAVAETSPDSTTEKPAENSAAETPTSTTAEATKPAPTRPRPRNRRSRTPRSTRATTPPAETATTMPTLEPTPAPATEPEVAGPRLIIETRDGMRVERYMTTVRRVTVERGQLVVVTRDGKVERQPMSNVLRMAIEP
jgi:hypothetical protein